jgi:hypothetical protein
VMICMSTVLFLGVQRVQRRARATLGATTR